MEFVEMLPFTPANRNNLIGWIAGRSDGEHYGDVDRLRLPEDAAGRRAAADRGADRSERAALGPAVAVEPAGIARAARAAAGDSDRPARCSTPRRSTSRPSAARCPSCGSSCWRCRIGWSTRRRSKRRSARLFGAAGRRGVAAPRRRAATARAAPKPPRPPATGDEMQALIARGGAEPRRLSAADGGGQAGRGRAEARGAEADARRVEQAAEVTGSTGFEGASARTFSDVTSRRLTCAPPKNRGSVS